MAEAVRSGAKTLRGSEAQKLRGSASEVNLFINFIFYLQ